MGDRNPDSDALDFRARAAWIKNLARRVSDQQAEDSLNSLAGEYEQKAAELERKASRDAERSDHENNNIDSGNNDADNPDNQT
jgi:hypothetical protein